MTTETHNDEERFISNDSTKKGKITKKYILVLFSQSELALIDKASETDRMQRAEWIRLKLLKFAKEQIIKTAQCITSETFTKGK